MAKKSSPSVAYFEEADDDGHLIPGTEPKYARSTAASSSPSKEKPNTSRSRKDSFHRESKSPTASLSDSDTTEHLTRRDSKIKMKEERKRSSLIVKQQRAAERAAERAIDRAAERAERFQRAERAERAERPRPHSHKTAPVPSSRNSDESSYYGVPPQTVSSASSRPRARTRPESYYGQRPPLSTSAYAHQPPPHPSHLPPTSYPLPWVGGPPPPPMGHALVHQPISSSPHGEFQHPGRDLASRFQRPQSAMGFQPPPPKPLEYEPTKEKALTRRTSVSRKVSKEHEDSRRMPPPPRPASTQPNRLVFRPPPPSHTSMRRKSVGFEDDDLLDADPAMYKAVARREVEYGSGALPSRPRHPSFDAESIYDVGSSYEIEPATRGRRASFYNFEDKVRDASRYQEDVSGGPAPPLTAEALRRVKNGGSSRSTRSTASRDESDYKQSATTRTTRSSSADDDITIKLPMGAVIEVGNTKIHCKDGGGISIGRGNPSRNGGSDHAASASNYSDDRKSRGERAAARTRASSQTGSYSRTRHTAPPLYPPGPPGYDHYDDYDPRYAPPGILSYPDDDEESYYLA
ncbi:hypothetical protein F4776DRAFT_255214 [Hypoxylon sp. NC0597]|nr:hypothetical protein F4776DRAFT_255214 [Hypoxylon sp. NC0597]